eukprot:775168-Pelagomonas_calceolata.AAC.1
MRIRSSTGSISYTSSAPCLSSLERDKEGNLQYRMSYLGDEKGNGGTVNRFRPWLISSELKGKGREGLHSCTCLRGQLS